MRRVLLLFADSFMTTAKRAYKLRILFGVLFCGVHLLGFLGRHVSLNLEGLLGRLLIPGFEMWFAVSPLFLPWETDLESSSFRFVCVQVDGGSLHWNCFIL